MLTRHHLTLLLAALLFAGCRPQPPGTKPPAAETPPPVLAFTQFSAGDTLDLVQTQLNLNAYEVRYRSSMPAGEMGMVYFTDQGNLHVDVRKIGDTWVLLSTPLLDPSTASAADRIAEWDRGADPQNRKGASSK